MDENIGAIMDRAAGLFGKYLDYDLSRSALDSATQVRTNPNYYGGTGYGAYGTSYSGAYGSSNMMLPLVLLAVVGIGALVVLKK